MASVGELLSAATARTGLDDFGDDSFREGLEILVAALRDEARLNARGEGFIYKRIGLHLAQRLQVEDWPAPPGRPAHVQRGLPVRR